MKIRKITKNGYKVVRSVLFTAIALVVFIYLALYVTLSIPAVQNQIRKIGEKELSNLFKSEVRIGNINIAPFNEVIADDVVLFTPEGEKCLEIGTLGAGISLWDLLAHQRILITYAELIGLDGKISQSVKDGPLNIAFIIDAFKPKEKNKPPTKFRLDIRNIVIRKSSLSFDRDYIPPRADGLFDPAHISISGLSADVALPLVSNDSISVDLRRLAFHSNCGLELRHLSLRLKTDPHHIALSDFMLKLPGSQLRIADMQLGFNSLKTAFSELGRDRSLTVDLYDSWVTPSDLRCFYAPLASVNDRYTLALTAHCDRKTIRISDLSVGNFSGDNPLVSTEDIRLMPPTGMSFGDPEAFARMSVDLGSLRLDIPTSEERNISALLPAGSSGNIVRKIADAIGGIRLEATGKADLERMTGEADLSLQSDAGNIDAEINVSAPRRTLANGIKADISILLENIATADAASALGINIPIDNLSMDLKASADINPSAAGLIKSDITKGMDRLVAMAEVDMSIPHALFKGHELENVTLTLTKRGHDFSLRADSPADGLKASLEADGTLDGGNSVLTLHASTPGIRPDLFTASPALKGAYAAGRIDAEIHGDRPDMMTGRITLSDLIYDAPATDLHLDLTSLDITSDFNDEGTRISTLRSDWVNGEVKSTVRFADLVPAMKQMAAGVMPQLLAGIAPSRHHTDYDGRLEFSFTASRHTPWKRFGKLPVIPLYNVTVGGDIDLAAATARLTVDAPYLQQGRDKLIRESRVDISLADNTADVKAHSVIPTKKGILHLNADIAAHDDMADISFDFNPDTKGGFYGTLALQAAYMADLNNDGKKYVLKFLPSSLYLNNAEWLVGKSTIEYADKRVSVDSFSVAHGGQHVTINGLASALPDDRMVVELSDIDLNYIFDTLNINYVSFGGIATGTAVASGAFSGTPDARTTSLHVKDLSYNNCVLGDGELRGDFDIKQMRVGIGASIDDDGRHVADIDGGIWIGRDSLSFGIDADRVRIDFLQTFMQAFSSEVKGRASGKGLLYGTFKDINMTGRFFADTISLKVDYTNVTYAGSDSVVLTPGRIDIPKFTLRDRYGHTATLSGNLRHRYFHDPYFNFAVRGARSMLMYDTNASMNPIWYGRIFGTGSGMINGTPSLVEIIADMTTGKDSEFTFVLDDTLEATDYTFLTFTDKRKAMHEALMEMDREETDDIVAAFNKKVEDNQRSESAGFAMDIRATITPDTKMTLVMDPAAGDRIVARGSGPLNISYESVNDEMRMYGKYTLDEGKYNFTLQDLILKDFIIKPGSSVSFNGDPMAAMLNIRAAYRVNTNLTDLDKSFATDRDLNRTNVPVDAMLLVSGDMTNPDIRFDIELPTLNEEVTQKVRSIISSDDMMNRQIIYLLALNRFYSPEYMGNNNSGGEWASVASSTLSSQLQNILGQLTDKFTVAPSLRSDKGDFSDLEVDVALSSRLFNNRLLINGNLGYRDRSTSSTTFVGDFDVEYLLTPNGNLRLKAYNHFNDQNYYLKSALTTQGIGVVFRRDFDDLLPKRKKKKIRK